VGTADRWEVRPTLARLLPRPIIHDRDRHAAIRAVAYFLIVAGVVVGACAVLVPGFAGGTTTGVIGTVLICSAEIAVGLLCRFRPERVPDAFLIAVPLLAIGLIGVLNRITTDISVSSHLYLLWPLFYAATFLHHRLAYLMCALACAVDAAVTITLQPLAAGLPDAAAMSTAMTVATVVITKLRERANALVAILEEQAMSDPLTGLSNRRAFDRDLALTFGTAHLSGAPLCLMIIDVDHFKTINDTWGHAAGDAVLRCIAEALRRTIDHPDIAARLGGDEFAAVVNADPAQAVRLAETLRAVVARTTPLPDGLPTLSIGLAETTAATPDPHALLATADRALYTAKMQGRDRVSAATTPPEPQPRSAKHVKA